MGKKLATNVYDADTGTWYGPAHGNADRVPSEVAGRFGDHVWEEPADDRPTAEGAVAGGIGGAGQAPAAAGKPVDEMTKAELVDLAAERGVDVSSTATKAEIVDALNAAGVQ